jgi:chemotaxis protein MotB
MRKRRTPVEEPAKHDRWLVSYSDLVTTLFCFFVVLFASSYRDNKTIEGVSQAIHNGFQTMGAFPGDQSKSSAAYPAQTAMKAASAPAAQQADMAKSSTRPVDVAELQQQLGAAIGQEIKNHEVDTRVTPEGFVISLKELGFFRSGQAALMPGASEKIARIAKVLASHGLELRVEGHSDDQPIHNAQFASNWELSTARAMAVMLMILKDSSYDPGKISVSGYGEFRPIADNATAEGRSMNRRVDLVVVETVAAAARPQAAAGQ